MVSMEYLIAVRKAVVDEHIRQEATKGSGWYPYDLGAELRHERGEIPISKRPVVMQEGRRVHIIEPDVAVVVNAINQFIAKVETAKTDIVGCGIQFQNTAVALCKDACEYISEGRMTLDTQQWNYVLNALVVANIQIAHTHVG